MFHANYGDDTGYHRSDIDSFHNQTPEIADVELQRGDSLYLTPTAEGELRIELEVPGWEGQKFVFKITVRTVSYRNQLDAGYLGPEETEDGGSLNFGNCGDLFIKPEESN